MKNFVIAALLLCVGFVNAQSTFYKTSYISRQPAQLNNAANLGGGFYFACNADSLFTVLKTDSNGNALWVNNYGAGYAAAVTNGGSNIVVAGSLNNSLAVLCLNAAGSVQWQAYYSDTINPCGAFSLVQLADSSFIAEGSDGTSLLLMHVSASGNVLSVKSLQAPVNRGFLAALPNGGFIHVSANFPIVNDSLSFMVLGFDSGANAVWARQYAWYDYFVPSYLQNMPDGNFLISGMVYDSVNNQLTSAPFLAKIDTTGKILWARRYSDATGLSDCLVGPAIAVNGGLVATGSFIENNIASFYCMKTDTAGLPMLSRYYSTNQPGFVTSVGVQGNGYMLLGSGPASQGGNNMLMLKTDSVLQTGCNTDTLAFIVTPVLLDTEVVPYFSTIAVTPYSQSTYTQTSDTATLNTLCISSPYGRYQPLLGSINIWHYIGNEIPEAPAPASNNSKDLHVCGYPLYLDFLGEEYTNGDTIIAGVLYKMLWDTISYYNSCVIGFIREDTLQRRVYFKDNIGNSEQVLYDFSLIPGDTLTIWSYNRIPYLFHLDSVSSFFISGNSKHVFFLHYLDNYQNRHNEIWVESIGSLYEFVYPYTNYFPGEGGGGLFPQCYFNYSNSYSQILSCFSHNQLVYFDSCAYAQAVAFPQCYSIQDSCDFGIICGGIKQVASLNSFNIYPNPADNQFTIDLNVNQTAQFSIEILNLQGQQVMPLIGLGELNSGEQLRQVNVEGLAAGLYLVGCKTGDGEVFRKLVLPR